MPDGIRPRRKSVKPSSMPVHTNPDSMDFEKRRLYVPPSFITDGMIDTVSAAKVIASILAGATHDDVQDWINTTQSAGRISGGAITATDVNGGDGTVIIAAGTGFIKMTDSAIGETKFFNWSQETGFALTDNSINYIFVRYRLVNSTPTVTIEKTTDRTAIELNREFTLGRVYRAGNATHIINSGIHIDNSLRLNHERLVQVRGFERGSGGVITEDGVRYLNSSAGVFFLGANKVETVLQDTKDSGHKFTWWYHVDGAWYGATGQEQVDNQQWDNGTALALLTGNRYGVQWVFIHVDSDLHVVCGRGNYTLAQAENAMPPAIPSIVSEFSILAAKIIIQHEGPNFKSVVSAYEQYFPISFPPDHNDLTTIQGGTSDPTLQYYHLTSAEYTELQAGYVTKALFGAHSIIAAVEDNTPLELSVAEQRLVGRITGGNIAALTAAQVLTLIGVAAGADVTGSNPPQAHGADKHTDINRWVWLPVNTGHVLFGTPGTDSSGAYVEGAANADEPMVLFSIPVPDDFVSFVSMKAVWKTGATSKNMRWRLFVIYGAANEAINTHFDAPATGQTASSATADYLNVQEPATALTLANLAIGDYMHIQVARYGTHEDDTLDEGMELYGLLFTYVANQ